MTAHVPLSSLRPLYSQDGTLLAFVPRRSKIPPRQYRLYADLILSGDIAECTVPALLDEEPEFARWYRDYEGRAA